jgi:hypothetical protein
MPKTTEHRRTLLRCRRQRSIAEHYCTRVRARSKITRTRSVSPSPVAAQTHADKHARGEHATDRHARCVQANAARCLMHKINDFVRSHDCVRSSGSNVRYSDRACVFRCGALSPYVQRGCAHASVRRPLSTPTFHLLRARGGFCCLASFSRRAWRSPPVGSVGASQRRSPPVGIVGASHRREVELGMDGGLKEKSASEASGRRRCWSRSNGSSSRKL